MKQQSASTYCSDVMLAELVATVKADARRGMRDLDAALGEYPEDARLHFLKGSLLAGDKDFAGARISMRRAVDLAPDFQVARFQLGFLLLTSGEPHAAQEVWGPLHALPSENYIHLFVKGLCHLIRDEFRDATRDLQDGMDRNTENPVMNNDMQLVIDQIRSDVDQVGGEGSRISSVDFLLQQSALSSKH